MASLNAAFLQIEPTTRCNFACGFCAGRHMPQQNMEIELLEEVLRAAAPSPRPSPVEGERADARAEARATGDAAAAYSPLTYSPSGGPAPSPRPSPKRGDGESSGLRHVELQGEGEPMLHPQFFEMAEMIRRLHPAAKISLITNGSMLNEENVARIIAIGFHKISVSIESPDPEAFAEIRGGKLEKVLDGIKRLMGARRRGARDREGRSPSPRSSPIRGEGEIRRQDAAATSGPAVGLAVTVLRRTMHELPRIVELYEELGLDGGITVQPLQTMPAYAQHYDAAMQAQVLTPIDRWHLAEEFQNHPRLREFFSRRPPVSGFYDELFAGWDQRSGECPWLARGLYVAYSGQTTGCCFIKNAARDGFGELTPATAEQVAARREALQAELRAGQIPGPCRDCPVATQIVARRRPAAISRT
jgi:MoaA/NifB/PqqE/SkfB family radical SAM enzyme